MTDKDKSRSDSSSDIADIVRDVANNVKEVVEDLREDVRAVAQELGLADPDKSSRQQSAVQATSDEPSRPIEDNRYDPQPVETKWFER